MPANPEFIDCFVDHGWSDQEELVSYLPRGWRDYVGTVGPHGTGPRPIGNRNPFQHPQGDVLQGSTADHRPGSSLGVTDLSAFTRFTSASALVLSCGIGRNFPAMNLPQYTVAICRAINDWTIDRWLGGPDGRMFGSILVPNQVPAEAAAEIRRASRNSRMVQVVLGANGLSKPFGHPAYHPIYEAAVECGLPVAIHAGSDATADSLSSPTAVSAPLSYGEYAALSGQSIMTHIASLIGQGVFTKYPDLKVLVVGGGVGWIPSFLWRFELNYRAFGRDDPWVNKPPSEYFRTHIKVATFRMELEAPELLAATIGAFAGLDNILCFGSGFPAAESVSIESVLDSVPVEWRQRVSTLNAVELYGSRITANAPSGVGASVQRSDSGRPQASARSHPTELPE